MHLLKAEEILRIHDAVLERFGGLKSQPMTPDAGLSKAQALSFCDDLQHSLRLEQRVSVRSLSDPLHRSCSRFCRRKQTHGAQRRRTPIKTRRIRNQGLRKSSSAVGGTGARPNQVGRNRRTPANRYDRLREVHGRPRTLRSIRHTGIQENFPANAAAPSLFRCRNNRLSLAVNDRICSLSLYEYIGFCLCVCSGIVAGRPS